MLYERRQNRFGKDIQEGLINRITNTHDVIQQKNGRNQKNPHKLLEVLLTYVVCVTYDVLEESTNEATMLIGASWGRVINDIAKEKGMTRKEVFFQADMLGNLAGGTTDWNSMNMKIM